MEFTAKEYNIIKTKKYCQSNSLFIFFNGVNRHSHDWIMVEQTLKKMNFYYYKIFNKTSKKTLQNSIYLNVSPLVNGITFLLCPILITQETTENCLKNNFEPLLFTILALKLNNKIYSKTQLNNNYSFNYKENKLLFFHFGTTNIKFVIDKKS